MLLQLECEWYFVPLLGIHTICEFSSGCGSGSESIEGDSCIGSGVGAGVGATVGADVGTCVGIGVGTVVGSAVGAVVGAAVGSVSDSAFSFIDVDVETGTGVEVGFTVGLEVGLAEGITVGFVVGVAVGFTVGVEIGTTSLSSFSVSIEELTVVCISDGSSRVAGSFSTGVTTKNKIEKTTAKIVFIVLGIYL